MSYLLVVRKLYRYYFRLVPFFGFSRANSKADLCSCEGKLSDLSNETQRLKQEVLQEKFEKEKTRQEFKKMASLCQTPPAISSTFNPSPTPGLINHLLINNER